MRQGKEKSLKINLIRFETFVFTLRGNFTKFGAKNSMFLGFEHNLFERKVFGNMVKTASYVSWGSVYLGNFRRIILFRSKKVGAPAKKSGMVVKNALIVSWVYICDKRAFNRNLIFLNIETKTNWNSNEKHSAGFSKFCFTFRDDDSCRFHVLKRNSFFFRFFRTANLKVLQSGHNCVFLPRRSIWKSFVE